MSTKNVLLVSYPRSGQHYTQRLLEAVTGVDDYCVPQQCLVADCPGKKMVAHGRIPCPAGRRIQKHHDFMTDLPISDEYQYIILYRKPLHSIRSYYELETKDGNGVRLKRKGSKIAYYPDCKENWEEFAFFQAAFWRRFILKWSAAKFRSNVMLMDYDDVTREPARVRAMFDFLFQSYDQERLGAELEKQDDYLNSEFFAKRVSRPFRYGMSDGFLDRVRQIIGMDALHSVGFEEVV